MFGKRLLRIGNGLLRFSDGFGQLGLIESGKNLAGCHCIAKAHLH